MLIHYFIYSELSPSARYRGKLLFNTIQNLSAAKTKFYAPSWNSVPPLLVLIFKTFFKLNKTDIFIVQKICAASRYQKIISWVIKHSSKTIYDIDDATYAINDQIVVDDFIKQVSHTVVASENLFNYVQQLNKNVSLITTPVPDTINIKTHKGNNVFTIGWIGIYKVHRENLFKILFPEIKKITHPIQLSLLGLGSKKDTAEITDYFTNHKNVTIHTPLHIDWENEAATQRRITSFDVGVMPLLDTEINRSKSAFKIKQYLSCGVPVIASDIGDNNQFVTNNKDGYLCKTNNDWGKYLKKMIAMSEVEYSHFCNSAHKNYTSSSYTLTYAAKKYLQIIESL
jgi:glycosyltransferase involved in cell wall biosynthesis